MDSNHSGPVCFEVPSPYEITYQGKKLIGSAQARRKQGVLQHGSLPLFRGFGQNYENFSRLQMKEPAVKPLND